MSAVLQDALAWSADAMRGRDFVARAFPTPYLGEAQSLWQNWRLEHHPGSLIGTAVASSRQQSPLPDKGSALIALGDWHEPPAAPLAVSYRGVVEVEHPAMSRWQAELQRLLRRCESRQAAGLSRLVGGRGALVGCPSCHSKLARKYLKSTDCPICVQSLLPISICQQLVAIGLEISRLRQELASPPEPELRPGVCWLIGGWLS